MYQIFDLESKVYVCPHNKAHRGAELRGFIRHLRYCNYNEECHFYMCSHDQFHWFSSQKERGIHESYECCPKNIEDQQMLNTLNEIILPLMESDAVLLERFLTQPKPQKRYKTVLNLFNQISHIPRKRFQKNCSENMEESRSSLRNDELENEEQGGFERIQKKVLCERTDLYN